MNQRGSMSPCLGKYVRMTLLKLHFAVRLSVVRKLTTDN
jgi:hypothetical protein